MDYFKVQHASLFLLYSYINLIYYYFHGCLIMGPNNSKLKGPPVRMLWLPNNFSNIFNLRKQATVKSESEKCLNVYPFAKLPLSVNGMVTKFHFDIANFRKSWHWNKRNVEIGKKSAVEFFSNQFLKSWRLISFDRRAMSLSQKCNLY